MRNTKSNIFQYSFETDTVSQLTNTEYNENYPIADSAGNLFYTADYNGITNIFRHDLNNNEAFPITNVITGVQQIDLDNNNNLVFSGFKKRGWDLYLMNSLDKSVKKEIKPTQFYANKNRSSDFEDLRNFSNKNVSTATEDYSKYIFARNYQYRNSKKENDEEVEIDSLRFQDDYIARKYQTEFSVDYIATTATIDN